MFTTVGSKASRKAAPRLIRRQGMNTGDAEDNPKEVKLVNRKVNKKNPIF